MGLSQHQMDLMRQLASPGGRRKAGTRPLLNTKVGDYVLNPLEAANLLGAYSPGFNEVAANLFGLNQAVQDRQIAAFNNKTGPFPKAIGYQLTPDVFYKRQLKMAPDRSIASPIEFVTFKNVPMMDWDTPDINFHPDSSVTVRNLGDVEDILRGYIQQDPTAALMLYQTPGGYRAFELGKTGNPVDDFKLYQSLNVDPNYIDMNRMAFDIGQETDKAGFRARISSKPGRKDDYVAQPIAAFKGAEAVVNPRSRKVISTIHDEPIRRAFMNADGVNPAAVETVKAQMQTASKPLQREIMRRLGI